MVSTYIHAMSISTKHSTSEVKQASILISWSYRNHSNENSFFECFVHIENGYELHVQSSDHCAIFLLCTLPFSQRLWSQKWNSKEELHYKVVVPTTTRGTKGGFLQHIAVLIHQKTQNAWSQKKFTGRPYYFLVHPSINRWQYNIFNNEVFSRTRIWAPTLALISRWSKKYGQFCICDMILELHMFFKRAKSSV